MYGYRLDISLESIIDNFTPLNKSQLYEINKIIHRIENIFKEVAIEIKNENINTNLL